MHGAGQEVALLEDEAEHVVLRVQTSWRMDASVIGATISSSFY
jgi:hypothetical protein